MLVSLVFGPAARFMLVSQIIYLDVNLHEHRNLIYAHA